MPKMVIVAFGPMHYDDEDTKHPRLTDVTINEKYTR